MVELLVTIAIVGILIALLLVALGGVREASRRNHCQNNLRQVGLALANYHAALGSLPPAVIWAPPGEPMGGGQLPIGVIDRVARLGDFSADTVFANWLLMALPFLEQGTLAAQLDSRLPIGEPKQATVREKAVPVLGCPSDSYNRPGALYQRGLAVGLTNNRYARGNYALNVGPDKDCLEVLATPEAPCHGGFLVTGTDLATNNSAVWGAGVGGANRSFRFADITDGLSQTIVVDEIRAGLAAVDPRGAWALGQVGASLVARHGRFSDVGGPNSRELPGDEIIGCGALAAAWGSTLRHGMPCAAGTVDGEINAKAGARSLHPGIVQVLCADGSVHAVSDPIALPVWHSLHTRAGSETLEIPF